MCYCRSNFSWARWLQGAPGPLRNYGGVPGSQGGMRLGGAAL